MREEIFLLYTRIEIFIKFNFIEICHSSNTNYARQLSHTEVEDNILFSGYVFTLPPRGHFYDNAFMQSVEMPITLSEGTTLKHMYLHMGVPSVRLTLNASQLDFFTFASNSVSSKAKHPPTRRLRKTKSKWQ